MARISFAGHISMDAGDSLDCDGTSVWMGIGLDCVELPSAVPDRLQPDGQGQREDGQSFRGTRRRGRQLAKG